MRRFIAAVLFLSAASATSSLIPKPLWAAVEPLTFQEYTLANGMTVVLYEDHSVGTVTVDVLYKVGSKNEAPGMHGFAHLFEHLNFEGSANIPTGMHNKLVTMDGGYTNADTTQDRTNYYDTVPSNAVGTILWIKSDEMRKLNIDQARLDKEVKVVLQEKAIRMDNAPYGKAMSEVSDLAWDDGNPYKWSPIGSSQDVAAAAKRLPAVERFHDVYYTPNNAVLTIAGDVDPKTVIPLIQKYFGTIPRGPEPPALAVPPASPLSQRRERTITDPKASLARIYMAYRIPSRGEEARSLAVLSSVLGESGRVSRLVDELEYKQRMVVHIQTGIQAMREASLFLIVAIPAPGKTPAQIESAINQTLAEVAQKGISEREMAQTKARLDTLHRIQLQEMENVASSLAGGAAFEHDPDSDDADLRAIQTMPRAAPVAALKKYLNPDSAAVVTVLPQKGEQP